MTTMQGFWTLMAVLVLLLVGMSVAESAGSATGSAWGAAGVGVLGALVVGYVCRPFQRDEEGDGFLDQFWATHHVFAKVVAFVAWLAIAGLAIYRIIDSQPNELGIIDYAKPAGGGFGIGLVIFALWTYAKSRKSDVSQ